MTCLYQKVNIRIECLCIFGVLPKTEKEMARLEAIGSAKNNQEAVAISLVGKRMDVTSSIIS